MHDNSNQEGNGSSIPSNDSNQNHNRHSQIPNNQHEQQQSNMQYQQSQSSQQYYQTPPPPNYGQYPPPPMHGYPYPPQVVRKTNTKSIIGLILGCLSIVLPYIGLLIGIAGIIINALALKEIKRRNEDGKGLALGGLITSIIGTLIYGIIILFAIIFFVAAFSYSSSYNYY